MDNTILFCQPMSTTVAESVLKSVDEAIDAVGLSAETLKSKDRKESLTRAASQVVEEIYGEYDDYWSELTDWGMGWFYHKNGPDLDVDEIPEVGYTFGVLTEFAEQAGDDHSRFVELFDSADNTDEAMRRGYLLKGAECMILNRLVEGLIDAYSPYPF